MIYAENILLCIAIPLVISLLFLKGEFRKFTGAFLLGMGMSLISAYIGGFINVVSGMTAEATAVYISPIVEELLKFAPLIFFIAVFDPKSKSLTTIAVAVGTGFATFENCCYILSSGAENTTYIVIRGLAVGVMHIVSIFALAIWLTLAKGLRAFSFPTVVGAISLSITFHAIYNLLVAHPGVPAVVGYALPVVAASLLALVYARLRAFTEEKSE